MKNKQTIKSKEKQIPQSRKKVLDYFNDVVDKQDFKNAIWEIRTKYAPARIGVAHGPDDEDGEMSFYPLSIDGEYFLDDKTEEIEKEIEEKILKKYALSNAFAQALWYHIFYDLDFWLLLDKNTDVGLCITEDLKVAALKKKPAKTNSNELETFPLAIKISPYASERDIIDFVQKEFTKTIKPILQKYKDDKIKLGKTKVKNELTSRRNQLIWSLRGMPRQEIATALRERTHEILDVGHIGKIISLERQRRKEP